MRKNFGRKTLSALFFILIFIFTYLVFRKENIDEPSIQDMMYFGGILLSSLLLFLLAFSRTATIKTINEGKKKDTKRQDVESMIQKEQIEREQMEESTLTILRDIQKQTDINEFAETILIRFSKLFATVQGVAYTREKEKNSFKTVASYALYEKADGFIEGSGINGQVAINKKPKLITEIPENYITVISGLGTSSPSNLMVIPFVYQNKTVALIELAAFDKFPEYIFEVCSEINDSIAEKFNLLTK